MRPQGRREGGWSLEGEESGPVLVGGREPVGE